jgi:MFS family permease
MRCHLRAAGPWRPRGYTRPVSRLTAIVLLAVFGAGVFLAGLELMITAVALPSIVTDLADWTHLRRASWIVNGYLLVYIVAMPLAGRLSDVWGSRRLFLWALAIFIVGSALAGRAQSLDELILARLVQAVGGGALVPVATAAASHLFEGHARPRALGIVGALTFLGMAAGPFLGAAILSNLHVEGALVRAGLDDPALAEILVPAWRWVFYINVPIGIAALAIAWAASHAWDTPRRGGRVDVAGGVVFSVALATGLVAITLVGAEPGTAPGDLDPTAIVPWLTAAAAVATIVSIVAGLRRADPFLDPRLFRIRAFSSATLVSLLTGYGFATAIIGGAVFVDRVLYGGPADQQVALGALAGATAAGALVSGFAVRVISLRLVTIVGLAASTAALVAMAGWTPATPLDQVARGLGVFGLGFGLTVTPRSTAAVEAVGRAAFGAASAAVTVARMIGMAVGLAVLTAFGSTTIDRLYEEVYATPDAYKAFIPEALRDRPLRDGLVVEALEAWAAGEAARIMVGIFLVAAGLTVAATPAALAMGERTGHAAAGSPADGTPEQGEPGGDSDDAAPTFAL